MRNYHGHPGYAILLRSTSLEQIINKPHAASEPRTDTIANTIVYVSEAVYTILRRYWDWTPEEDVRPLTFLMSD